MEYLELLKIKGIPLRVHPSWIFILILFTWFSQGHLTNLFETQLSLPIIWTFSFFSSLMVFGSVLLHELGHSFMALHEGVKIRSITLFFLGGFALSDKDCDTPISSLRVALAGPLVSFLLAFFFFLSAQFISSPGSILSTVFFDVASINLFFAVFNLLPGLPFDGGLIIKSIVWHFTGSKRQGLKIANACGKWLSLFGLFLGSLVFIQGGGLFGLWLMLISWFGFSFSRSQNQIFKFQDILCKSQVKDASSRGFRVLEGNRTLLDLSRLPLNCKENEFSSEWVLLCDSGRWSGYVTQEVLKEVPSEFWGKYFLSEYCKQLSDLPSIADRDPLWQAVLKLDSVKEDRLLVFNLAGLPCSTIDRVDIGKAVLSNIGIVLPKEFFDSTRKKRIYPLGMSLVKLVEGMISSGLISRSDKEI